MNDVVINPETGEQLWIRQRAADTQGAYFEFDNWIPADLDGPPIHMHPSQTEQFEVLSGTLRAWVGGQWQCVEAGGCLRVDPGVFHTFSNRGLPPLHVRVRISPAWDAEKLFEGLMNLQLKRSRWWGLLRLSWLLTHVDSYFYFRGPRRLQRAVFALLGRIGGARAVCVGQQAGSTPTPSR